MPLVSADFCVHGHRQWPSTIIANGTPLHYLCHTRFLGQCTSDAHSALCVDTFDGKEFTLPAVCHSHPISVFLQQKGRSAPSEELHDYLVKAAAVYSGIEVIKIVAAHPALVPHYRLIVAAGQIEPPVSPAEQLACIVGGICTPPLHDMKMPAPVVVQK